MDIIISEKQKEKFKSMVKSLVEDINVPLAIKIDVEMGENGTIYVVIPLKNYLGYNAREKYESLIRNKIKDYIGLEVVVVLLEKFEGSR